MATQHLDLDEQEQIANIKYFWQKYGTWISAVLVCIAVTYAGWTAWNFWQSSQAQKAAVLFEELTKAAHASDIIKTERVFGDLKDKYGSTAYAAQAALLNARVQFDGAKLDAAKSSLEWLVASSADAAYTDIGRLRLAGMLIEAKNYDQAITLLQAKSSAAFAPLMSDRLGDAYSLQNKLEEAKTHYQKAYAGLPSTSDYRKIVEVKLARLGVDTSLAEPK